MGRNRGIGFKHVIGMHRTEKTVGGKMRPKVIVFYTYDLDCGHSVERRKKAGQHAPEYIECKECHTPSVD